MQRSPSIHPGERKATEGMVETARRLAARAHGGRFRKQSGEPFFNHPAAVAELISTWTADPEVLAAAYLHDVLEKTDVNASQLRLAFGDRVADVVIACTEDPSTACYADRKRSLRKKVIAYGNPANAIYAADRVANLRDWGRLDSQRKSEVGVKLGTSFDERMMLWREDLRDLSATDPDLPFLGEIETLLHGLERGRRDAA